MMVRLRYSFFHTVPTIYYLVYTYLRLLDNSFLDILQWLAMTIHHFFAFSKSLKNCLFGFFQRKVKNSRLGAFTIFRKGHAYWECCTFFLLFCCKNEDLGIFVVQLSTTDLSCVAMQPSILYNKKYPRNGQRCLEKGIVPGTPLNIHTSW